MHWQIIQRFVHNCLGRIRFQQVVPSVSLERGYMKSELTWTETAVTLTCVTNTPLPPPENGARMLTSQPPWCQQVIPWCQKQQVIIEKCGRLGVWIPATIDWSHVNQVVTAPLPIPWQQVWVSRVNPIREFEGTNCNLRERVVQFEGTNCNPRERVIQFEGTNY